MLPHKLHTPLDRAVLTVDRVGGDGTGGYSPPPHSPLPQDRIETLVEEKEDGIEPCQREPAHTHQFQ